MKAKYLEGNIYLGLDDVMRVLRDTNRLVQDAKPWELAKSPGSDEQLRAVLHVALEVLRVSAIVLQPVIPVLSARILDKLQIGKDERAWCNAETATVEKRSLTSDKTHIFTRLKV